VTKPEEKLKRAIEGTGIAEVLQTASNEEADPAPEIKKVVVQSRVGREDVPKWLSVIDFVLQEEEEQDTEEGSWSAHCCKTYVRHDGKLGFVWSITISSRGALKRPVNDVSRAIRTLSASLKSVPAAEAPFAAPRATRPNAVQRAARAVASGRVANTDREPVVSVVGDRVEVEEMPLIGVTEDRNKPDGPGGKGAQYISGG
jgi:hypothetical protein